MPLVTVTMAVRNVSPYIAAAIQSVRGQTLQDWELIVVDDASDDNTVEGIQPFLVDPRIQLVRLATHSRVAAGRNAGFSRARAPFITMLDGDDVYLPDALAQLTSAMRQAPSHVGLIYGDHIRRDEATGIETRVRVVAPAPRPAIFRQICCVSPVLPSASIVRREVWQDYGPFDINNFLAAEFDFWTRALERYDLANINTPVVVYRRHQNQVTSPTNWEAFRANRDTHLHRIMTRLGLRGLFPEATSDDMLAEAVDGLVARMLSVNYPAWSTARFLLEAMQSIKPAPAWAQFLSQIPSTTDSQAT